MSTEDGGVRNLNIRQNWLDEEVENIVENYEFTSIDEAFIAFVYGIIFDESYDAIQPEEIVDGKDDKQIDVIRIDDDSENGSAHVHLMQVKNRRGGFSPNIIIQMGNGLKWMFELPKAEYSQLDNPELIYKIGEIRDLRKKYGTSNLSVSMYLVTNGDTRDISKDVEQERRSLKLEYGELGFSEFNIHLIGAFELYELLNESLRRQRQIDLNMAIVYDANRGSVIHYRSGDTSALICTVSGIELARIASIEPQNAIFDLNVRPFYGTRGSVNSDIKRACIGDESQRFWFLNNGITMVCDKFDLVNDPDGSVVKITNAQIVNGCQTTVTLREAHEQGELKSDVNVLVRLYSTDNPNLVERITLTTNNQNRITDRDLKANDSIQIDIQRVMEDHYGYLYERKNKEFGEIRRGEKKKLVVQNTKAAQAFLAIVHQRPSIARGFRYRVWGDLYQRIFTQATVEDLLASYLIYRYCSQQTTIAKKNAALSKKEQDVVVYGTFHIARVCGELLMKGNWGESNRANVANLIKLIESDTEDLPNAYKTAVKLIGDIWEGEIRDNSEKAPNPTLYFKAGDVEKKIAESLKSMAN